mmetsp:Transcript_28615/g.50700  ORF Transcript_28615/g.50700 Transcript_28615/m.50700 type:complete len:136 (+) Transcript_28615:2-409(+)
MVLTDRQREDLHAGIYEYLVSRGEAFEEAAKAFALAEPKAAEKKTNNVGKTPLLEKKWTAIPRLQKKSTRAGTNCSPKCQNSRPSRWGRGGREWYQRRIKAHAASTSMRSYLGGTFGACHLYQSASRIYGCSQWK